MKTIKDVARLANVAVSTASCAINGKGRVSEETRKKVLKAVEELGYRPSGVARDLKSSRGTGVICIFVDDLGGPFYSEVLRGIQEIIICNNYNLIACTPAMTEKYLSERRVDGAIILSPNITDELLQRVADRRFPIVVMDRELECNYIHNVLLDNRNGAYQATKYLIELGHRRIAYISGPFVSYDNIKRLEGFKAALDEYNIPFDQSLIVQGRFTEEGGYGAAKLLLLNAQLDKLPFDAIFCGNDEMAIGTINAMNDAGVRIPEDLSIVGYDDIRMASYVRPALTTVSHNQYEWGAMAANLIFRSFGDGGRSERVIMPAKLVIRDSCITNRKCK